MTPDKNGVVLYFPEYMLYARADVYEFSPTHTLFVANWSYSNFFPDLVHAEVNIGSGFMKELLNIPHRVIVVPKENIRQFRDWEENI